jgi:hypothetical protein
MKLKLNSLLKDKNVLYVILFLAITNIFGYLMLRNFDAIVFFFVVGFLSTYFSKNMIVVMIIAMISTNLLVGTKLLGKYKEGMATQATTGTPAAGAATAGAATTPMSPPPASAPVSMTTPPAAPAPAASAAPTLSSIPPAMAKKNNTQKPNVIDNMTTLTPASLDGSDDDTTDLIQARKPKINFASTLESAYDNLDKLLSSDSINRMSDDTQRLAQKQQVLMGNIEKLVPFIGKAENLLKGMNSDKMGGMLEKMQEQMANLSRVAK